MEHQMLVDDLADVLIHMVVGWEPEFGFDLAKHPDVVRVMARYRRERLGQGEEDVAGALHHGT